MPANLLTRPLLAFLPCRYLRIMKEDGLAGSSQLAAPGWRSTITTSTPARAESDNSTFIDQQFSQSELLAAFAVS